MDELQPVIAEKLEHIYKDRRDRMVVVVTEIIQGGRAIRCRNDKLTNRVSLCVGEATFPG